MKIKMSRWSSQHFLQIQNDFLFRRGACEGLNAMFADLILAFGLHAAKYSRGTLLLKELHMFLGVYWSTAPRAKFSLFDLGQSPSSEELRTSKQAAAYHHHLPGSDCRDTLRSCSGKITTL